MRDDWIRLIHVAKKKTGIDEEAYRAILSGSDLASSKEIRHKRQFDEIMSAFKNLGFVYNPQLSAKPGGKRRSTVSGRRGYITGAQEYYLLGLWSIASRLQTEASLNSLSLRITKIHDIHWLSVYEAQNLINAVKTICLKAGMNPMELEPSKIRDTYEKVQ